MRCLCLTITWTQTKQVGLDWVSCSCLCKKLETGKSQTNPWQMEPTVKAFTLPGEVISCGVTSLTMSVISRRSLKQRWAAASFFPADRKGIWCPTGIQMVLFSSCVYSFFDDHIGVIFIMISRNIPKQKRTTYLHSPLCLVKSAGLIRFYQLFDSYMVY